MTIELTETQAKLLYKITSKVEWCTLIKSWRDYLIDIGIGMEEFNQSFWEFNTKLSVVED